MIADPDMSGLPDKMIFNELYKDFSKSLTDIDCGEKCGPYNDYGVPVCCDIKLLVPAAFAFPLQGYGGFTP